MKSANLISLFAILSFSCKPKEEPIKQPEYCNDNGSYYIFTDSTSLFALPTAFTPNSDGRNDVYRIIGTPSFQPGSFQMTIT